MKSKHMTAVAGMAVLFLLAVGTVPVFAQTVQPSSSSPSTSSTTTTTSASSSASNSKVQTEKAAALIQLAQAAQTYANQVLSIAQGHGVNVANGTNLINQGSLQLTAAQSVLNTNATQAAKDALGAMKYFKEAVQSLQSAVVISVDIQNQVQYLQSDIQRLQNRTGEMQAAVTKLCSSGTASATICSDANKNLASATTEITNAASMLSAITSSSTTTQVIAIQTVLQAATNDLKQVSTDISTLANDAKGQQAITYVQTVLDPRVTQIQQQAQKANITSSQRTTILDQLTQAQTLLNSAVQSFQSGNFNTGVGQVDQAQALMLTALGEIALESGN